MNTVQNACLIIVNLPAAPCRSPPPLPPCRVRPDRPLLFMSIMREMGSCYGIEFDEVKLQKCKPFFDRARARCEERGLWRTGIEMPVAINDDLTKVPLC